MGYSNLTATSDVRMQRLWSVQLGQEQAQRQWRLPLDQAELDRTPRRAFRRRRDPLTRQVRGYEWDRQQRVDAQQRTPPTPKAVDPLDYLEPARRRNPMPSPAWHRTLPYLAPPKTTASYWTVPLADVVLDALSAYGKTVAAVPVLDQRGLEFALLVSDDTGRPIRRTRFNHQVWGPAALAAGLPKGTHFHELRHFYASLLLDGGESVKVAQSRLGDATADETVNSYAHLWPDTEDRSRAAVDDGLGLIHALVTEPGYHTGRKVLLLTEQIGTTKSRFTSTLTLR